MSVRPHSLIEHRIFRCGESDFYKDEILHAAGCHTEECLESIASAGFNGIWLRAKLRELAPGNLFEPFVEDVQKRLASLKTTCERAQDAGLGVWLFCTEPLGLSVDHPFWKKHPHLAGHKVKVLESEPEEYALCSSQPEVQQHLQDGFGQIFSQVPLAGVILITASEQVNNCWAHVPTNPRLYAYARKQYKSKEEQQVCTCERCKVRQPSEVISEIVNNIYTAVQDARPEAQVVAWDWSWRFHYEAPYLQITQKLNAGVKVMADFERGGSVTRLGKKRNVEEYSLVYPGPSPRYQRHVEKTTREHSLFAKLQINTTHELATVPSLPLVVSLYRKLSYLRHSGCLGVMACWNFACDTNTLNVSAAKDLLIREAIPSELVWLKSLAKEYFGPNADVDAVVKAWYGFQRAAGSYPVSGCNFLYYSPVNYALAYPLKTEFSGKLMGPSWLSHTWGDNLDNTLGVFTLAETITLLESLSKRWLAAANAYETSLSSCNTPASEQEIAVAKVSGCCFRSCWNIYRWYQLRKDKPSSEFSDQDAMIMEDELENIKTAMVYVQQDSRFGFHQESQCYMFDKQSIQTKISSLENRLGAVAV